MKQKIVFFFILMIFLLNKIVIAQKKAGFGEGIVTISQYNIPASDSIRMDTANTLFCRYTYYIKGDRVLRRDATAESNIGTSHKKEKNKDINIASTLSASLIHPSYLIDWERNQAYTFFKQNGKLGISLDTLKAQTTEIFYRLFLPDTNRKATVMQVKKDNAGKIADRVCYRGIGILNNDTILFSYTEVPYTVCSPLNGFFPDFPYNILNVTAKVKTPDGKTFLGFTVFTVTDIRECKLEDSLFVIPGNVLIRRNVSWQEMYNPLNK